MSEALDDRLADCLTGHLLALLRQRANTASICPSEAARAAAGELRTDWRELMRPVRTIAAGLAERGTIEAWQQGRRVDIREVRGPIRLKLGRAVR